LFRHINVGRDRMSCPELPRTGNRFPQKSVSSPSWNRSCIEVGNDLFLTPRDRNLDAGVQPKKLSYRR